MTSGFKSQSSKGDEISLVKVLNLYKKRWYLLVIALGLAIICCKLYLRYSTPKYVASATIKIEEESNPTQGLGLLESLGNFSSNIQSEIRLLRSRSLILRALREMNITASYYRVGTIITAEIHPDDTPFLVLYDTVGNPMYNRMFSVSYLGNNKFKLKLDEGQDAFESTHYFGEEITINKFSFSIIDRPTQRYQMTPGIEYKFRAIKWNSMLSRASHGLRVEQNGHLVPILNISLEDYVPKFTSSFINTLLKVYIEQDEEVRTQAANQQLKFIRSQVDTIQAGVEEAERILQDFKKDKKFFGVESRLNADMEKIRENEFQLVSLNIRLRQINRLESEIASNPNSLTFPFSLQGQDDPNLLSQVKSFNEIAKDKVTALQSFTSTHPRVIELDDKMRQFTRSIAANVVSIQNKINKDISYYEDLLGKNKVTLMEIPETQREYLSLTREYQVQSKILSTLLENQAEAQIAKASIVSPIRIVDHALIPLNPVSPNPRTTYIVGCGLGVCLGLLVIFLTGMMNTTLNYREEIENISLTPIIGVVRKSSQSINQKFPKLIVTESPKSALAESIRGIRTNLQFISSEKKSKIIAITSTISGEGKSFIIINLGGIFSMLDLKVVILDLDLRKPKLHQSFGYENTVGISTYLVGQNTLDEILMPTPHENLKIITSGPIPPNPAELVQSPRMQELLDRLSEEFDYVLVDTPPIGLVTDGATLIKKADIALYVIRSDYSKKNFATLPDKLVDEHQIENLYIIFNSVSTVGRRYGGYGYKAYNYGYYSDDPVAQPVWKFWKRFRFFRKLLRPFRRK